MFKLIKYLKKSTMSILVIIALLVVQALCDLALPDYTSKIVNVGIQQGGVENAVPEVIRKSEMDKVLLFMSSEDKDKVLDNYKLVEKDNLTEEDTKNYSKLDEVFLLFGKETKGLPEGLLKEHLENTIRIPMRETLRSLNLSNSVAIVAYEIIRQLGGI